MSLGQDAVGRSNLIRGAMMAEPKEGIEVWRHGSLLTKRDLPDAHAPEKWCLTGEKIMKSARLSHNRADPGLSTSRTAVGLDEDLPLVGGCSLPEDQVD